MTAAKTCSCGLNLDIWQNGWNHRSGCSMRPVTAAHDDGLRDELAAALAEWAASEGFPGLHYGPYADALLPVVRRAQARALREVRAAVADECHVTDVLDARAAALEAEP